MARFASEAELKAFLGKLDADYAEYASALWHEGIKTPRIQILRFVIVSLVVHAPEQAPPLAEYSKLTWSVCRIVSMARFASEAELKAFLGKLDADYAEYASALWHEGIKTPRQLANFTEPHYLACGVRRGHIDDIKARADTTGELLACNTL